MSQPYSVSHVIRPWWWVVLLTFTGSMVTSLWITARQERAYRATTMQVVVPNSRVQATDQILRSIDGVEPTRGCSHLPVPISEKDGKCTERIGRPVEPDKTLNRHARELRRAAPRFRNADHGGEGRLSAGAIRAGFLAECFPLSLHVKNVIHYLEYQPDTLAVTCEFPDLIIAGLA